MMIGNPNANTYGSFLEVASDYQAFPRRLWTGFFLYYACHWAASQALEACCLCSGMECVLGWDSLGLYTKGDCLQRARIAWELFRERLETFHVKFAGLVADLRFL